MGLYQRARGLTPGAKDFDIHIFGAAVRQLAAGQITRAQVIAEFQFVGDDVTQFDALVASYNAMPTNTVAAQLAKNIRLHSIEDVFRLVGNGNYDEAKAKAALGF